MHKKSTAKFGGLEFVMTSHSLGVTGAARCFSLGILHIVTGRCACGWIIWKLPLPHIWHTSGTTSWLAWASSQHGGVRISDFQRFKIQVLRDSGKTHQPSYELASEVWQCTFCCIFLLLLMLIRSHWCKGKRIRFCL